MGLQASSNLGREDRSSDLEAAGKRDLAVILAAIRENKPDVDLGPLFNVISEIRRDIRGACLGPECSALQEGMRKTHQELTPDLHAKIRAEAADAKGAVY